MLRYFTKYRLPIIIKSLNKKWGEFMGCKELQDSLIDFKKSLGFCHFSKELSETEFKLISLVTRAQENHENINLTTISTEVDVTRSAITQIVNKLEKKDYIEKYSLSTNKKEIYLRIGKKAIEQYDYIISKVSEFFERLCEAIGQEGVENLEKYLEISKKIGREMKGECDKCLV